MCSIAKLFSNREMLLNHCSEVQPWVRETDIGAEDEEDDQQASQRHREGSLRREHRRHRIRDEQELERDQCIGSHLPAWNRHDWREEMR